MQQTPNYKLNLIETSDTFSPEPLNENTEKLEEVLATKADAAVTATLEQRVTVLEVHHVYAGVYAGDGVSGHVINLGFTPSAVIIQIDTVGNLTMTTSTSRPSNGLTIQEAGFSLSSSLLNNKNTEYPFLALC